MSLEHTLVEYGKLKIKERELSKEIKRLFAYQDEHEESQLSEFFNYYKDFRTHERRWTGSGYTEPDPIADWAEDWGAEFTDKPYLQKVTETSQKLLDLIDARKQVKQGLRAKKISITRYAINLANKEAKHANS